MSSDRLLDLRFQFGEQVLSCGGQAHGGGIDGDHLAPGGAPGDLGEGHGRGDLAEGVEVLLGEPRVCGEDDLGPGVTHTLEVDAVGLVEEHRDLTAQLRSEEHTSELQSRGHLVCRLLLEKKKEKSTTATTPRART